MTASRSNPLLTPRQVAELLAVEVQTLANWRHKKTGPAYVHMGARVRYEEREVLDYIARQQVRRAA